jgi:hypothetical protein
VGIEPLKFFRDAIYSNLENGKLLWLNMQYSHLEAGIGQNLPVSGYLYPLPHSNMALIPSAISIDAQHVRYCGE